MTIGITAATGQLGRLVVNALLDGGTPPAEVVAIVRTPSKATELRKRGIDVRQACYTDAQPLDEALAGVDKLLLISGNETGQRLAQHTNVITRAKAAGVGSIVYTSVLNAQRSTLVLAAEHRATEDALMASGIDYTVLRNGWYWENYLPTVETARQTGTLRAIGGSGRLAAAARADYAQAAAAVLNSHEHSGKVYELGGDERITVAELVQVISSVIGKPVTFADVPRSEYAVMLLRAGLTSRMATTVANAEAGIAAGAFDTESGDLQRLIGRKSTPVAAVLAANGP
jgi:NAD(P)H dehydrogenase (quinone)